MHGVISQDTVVSSSAGSISGSGTMDAQAFAQLDPNDTGAMALVYGHDDLALNFRIVDQTESIHVNCDFGSLGFRGASSHFAVQEISDPNTPKNIFLEDNAQYTSFARDVPLAPGSYRLTVDTGAGSSGSNLGDASGFGEQHSLSFSFAVGEGGAVIPLPPALWAGLPTLLAAAAAWRARRWI